MGKPFKIIKEKNIFSHLRARRSWVQAFATLFTNIHLPNFMSGKIYTGSGKKMCVPGLNCYSCPGATGSCPIGSFQAVVGSSKFNFAYYITGILILFGVLVGRLICGFFCPFGWFQDLLYKIPTKKFSTKKLKVLRYLKYVILIVVVWLMGVFLVDNSGIAPPYFCKYICPQGILEGGIPLALTNPTIRNTLGKLFTWKSFILISISGLSIIFYRPFCKWICPLGAFYSLFNKISFYKYHVDKNSCISCGKCSRVCKMDVDITKCKDSLECIRCGECIKSCPTGAIFTSLSHGDKFKTKQKEQA
ncbi:4Fe-4S binding protein [Anaerosalibacter sp. Marseille-P3206]|uniref:4Fe-4S binding protein n=1 Tax=Anaerosalibacter sp. Marseille-P3206 TaxID=1871005 RepID=UPI0035106CC1